MSKTYKVLSVLLAVAMLFSVVAVSAFAAYTPTDTDKSGNAYTQTWALSEPVNNGDGTWSVNVSLKTNYPVGSIQFKVANTNNTGVKLTRVVKGAGFANDANVTFSNATGKVAIVPKTAGKTNLACSVVDGVVAVLTYTVESGASANVNIVNEPKGIEGADVGGSLVATRCGTADHVGDYIADGPGVVGQTVLSVGETRLIGTAATPKLVVIEGTGGVIDTTRTAHVMEDGTEYTVDGLIYGVEICDVEDEDGNETSQQTIEDVFEVKDGTMNIVANEAGSDCGTGTIVEVLDADENVVATYILVIFGDLDGDGEVTSLDATLAETHEILIYDEDDGEITDTVVLFAADVDGDEEVTSLDATSVSTHELLIYDEVDGCMSQAEVIAILTENDII